MKKLVVLGVMLVTMLALTMPAWADTVRAGGQIAGELEGGAVAAGSPNLAIGAPTLGPGEDAAGAGNFNSTFAFGLNDPFESNVAGAGGPGAAFGGSDFLGDNPAFVNSGGVEVETETTFFD